MEPGASPESASEYEFVSKDASDTARQYIARGRMVLYDPGMKDAVRAAITGAQSLADGCAAYIVQLIQKLEEKMGPLEEADYQMVVAHLAGSMVEMAQSLGDPEAEDGQSAVQSIIQAAMSMGQGQSEQAPPPQGPMAQFGGAQ